MARPKRSHNGGPPLDDYEGPPWGKGDPLFRLEKAEALGLSYEEYTLEILERGRHLGETDTVRVAAIKESRKRRRR